MAANKPLEEGQYGSSKRLRYWQTKYSENVEDAIASLWQPGLVKVFSEKKPLASGAYTAEDVVSESTTLGQPWNFQNCARIAGGGGRIHDALILAETTNIASWFSLFLHTAHPTCNLQDAAPNTAFALADRGIAVVRIEFPACDDIGSGMSETVSTPSTVGNLPKTFVCETGSRDLWGVLAIKNAVDIADTVFLRIVLIIEQF